MWTTAQLQVLAKFSMVTVEKYQQLNAFVPADTLAHAYTDRDGLYACQNGTNLSRCGCCVEDQMIAAFTLLKKINPKVVTIAYMNSGIAYPWYRGNKEFCSNPDYWLRDTKGNVIHNQKSQVGSNESWMVYDLSIPAVQTLWQDACLNLTRTGVVDSCFVDGCVLTVKGLSAAKERAVEAGKTQMLTSLQEQVPGPLICGSTGDVRSGVDGTQAEGWGKTGNLGEREIPNLMHAMRRGVVFQAHGYAVCEHNGDPHHPAVQTELAAFLIGMGNHSYYLCGEWENSIVTWYPVYDMPIGNPLSDAKLDKGVWHRNFASGTNVSFNVRQNVGHIYWG